MARSQSRLTELLGVPRRPQRPPMSAAAVRAPAPAAAPPPAPPARRAEVEPKAAQTKAVEPEVARDEEEVAENLRIEINERLEDLDKAQLERLLALMDGGALAEVEGEEEEAEVAAPTARNGY